MKGKIETRVAQQATRNGKATNHDGGGTLDCRIASAVFSFVPPGHYKGACTL